MKKELLPVLMFIMGVIAVVIIRSIMIESKNASDNVTLNDLPELMVFKACMDKKPRLFDEDICECASLVGHHQWCSGDIKY